MAVIRDMMPAFELFQPTSPEDAVALLAEHGDDSWVLAGGLDIAEQGPKVELELWLLLGQ